MVNSTREVRTRGSVLKLVLKSQTALEKTIKKAKELCKAYKGRPSDWSEIQLAIVNELMTLTSEMQASVNMFPEFSYNTQLQRIAAYLGDEFGLLSDIVALTTQLTDLRAKGEIKATLDEISDKCAIIFQRINDIKTLVAEVSAAL